MIEQSRRGFITGLGTLFLAAPAIVRASSLMPVKALPVLGKLPDPFVIQGELGVVMRRAFVPRLIAQIWLEEVGLMVEVDPYCIDNTIYLVPE